jgi:hypothetical protein
MPKFRFVNPSLRGDLNKIYSGKDQASASQKAWKEFSGYIAGSVKQFHFTMENINNEKLHHFVVNESVGSDSDVKSKISELVIKSDKPELKFKKALNKFESSDNGKLSGGMISDDDVNILGGGKNKKKSKADDSDSDSDSDNGKSHQITDVVPISYFWYYPLLYYPKYFYYPSEYVYTDYLYYFSYNFPLIAAPYTPEYSIVFVN